jgi:galactonate dehydratase
MGTRRSRRSFLAGGAAGAASALVLPRPLSALAAAVERAPRASSPSDLRITGVRGGLVRNQHSLFVKVETNQGIYGCAEAVDGVYGSYYVMKHIAEQHLVGRSPLDVHRLQEEMRRGGVFKGAQGGMYVCVMTGLEQALWDLVGRSPLDVHRLQEEMRRGGVFKGAQGGMYVCVMTGLEQALWDLVGKALGLPVYRLLGGKFRDKIRVYCDTAGSRLEPAEMGRRAKEDVEKYGFTAVKFDIDDARDPAKLDRYNWSVSPRELERMVAQIAAVREAVGPHVDVCVDCHGRFDEAAGHRIAKAMEPFGLLWLEEPVPAEFPEAYARIRAETTTPICGGENWYLTTGFRRPLEIGAVDVVMPDLQKCGGLGEGQRIANLANTYNVPFAPHMVASYLGAMASAHVCASVPNFLILEWQIYFHKNPMFEEIVDFDGPRVVEGHIPLSEKPGIGVEIDEEGMRKHAQPGVPFFE